MPAEAGLGHLPVRDAPVDAHIGERVFKAFAEGDGPAFPVRGAFPAMAVPRAAMGTAVSCGGTRLRPLIVHTHQCGNIGDSGNYTRTDSPVNPLNTGIYGILLEKAGTAGSGGGGSRTRVREWVSPGLYVRVALSHSPPGAARTPPTRS